MKFQNIAIHKFWCVILVREDGWKELNSSSCESSKIAPEPSLADQCSLRTTVLYVTACSAERRVQAIRLEVFLFLPAFLLFLAALRQ